jgi:hypothetical protein
MAGFKGEGLGLGIEAKIEKTIALNKTMIKVNGRPSTSMQLWT